MLLVLSLVRPIRRMEVERYRNRRVHEQPPQYELTPLALAMRAQKFFCLSLVVLEASAIAFSDAM